MTRFLTTLLYTPRHLGWLSIPQFSAIVQQIKLRMLVASLAEEGKQKATAESEVSGVDFSNG